MLVKKICGERGGCMFVALLKNGETCSLLDDWTVEQLHVLRATQSFFLPCLFEASAIENWKKTNVAFCA